MKEANFAVSESRERELLGVGTTSEMVAGSARIYIKKMQEESLEGLPEYLRYLYFVTDYLGVTSPEQRLEGKIKKSDHSCIKQRVMISHYEKQVRQQEQLITEKEAELRDCSLCYEKRKSEIEEKLMEIERLEEEKQDAEQRLRKNPADEETAAKIREADSKTLKANQDLRKYQREKTDFAAKIIEADTFISESQNVLVSVQACSSVLQKNYLRSRIERMRLAPLVSIGRGPVETIDLVVQDQKIAEETGRLADVMTEWVGEITEQMSELQISPRHRKAMYSDLTQRYSSSTEELTSIAEKIIDGQRKVVYLEKPKS